MAWPVGMSQKTRDFVAPPGADALDGGPDQRNNCRPAKRPTTINDGPVWALGGEQPGVNLREILRSPFPPALYDRQPGISDAGSNACRMRLDANPEHCELGARLADSHRIQPNRPNK